MLFEALRSDVNGIDANLIDVERGHRLRAVIKNSGQLILPDYITINLAPADLKKEGSGFELPIAPGMPGAYGALEFSVVSQFLMIGELGPDGSGCPILGMLPVAILAQEKNIPNLILPSGNVAEAAVVEGVIVYPLSSRLNLLQLLNSQAEGTIQRESYRVSTEALLSELWHFAVDFKDVRGQQTAKRAWKLPPPAATINDWPARFRQNGARQASAILPRTCHV
jgi:magnesium chelatase family protein